MFKDFLQRKDLSDAQAGTLVNLAKLSLQRDFDLTFLVRKLTAQTYNAGGFQLPTDFKKFPYQHSVILTMPTSGNIIPLEGTDFATILRRASTHSPQKFQGQTQPVIFTTDIRQTKYYIQMFAAEQPSPRLFLMPENTLTFDLYYVAWLPDYVNNNEEDFLLTYGRDALLYGSMDQANLFFMTEEKLPISAQARAAAIDRITEYCKSVELSGAHIDGD